MKQFHRHDDTNLMQFVIPGLTPYRVRGRLRNPVSFWIPAFAGMTGVVVTHDAVYRIIRPLVFIILFTFMGVIFAPQTSAQIPQKDLLPRGQEDSTQKKKIGNGPGRNPFSLPASIHLRSKSPAVPAALKAPERAPKGETKVLAVPPPPPVPLKVKAILISNQTRWALIDRHIVSVGDSIQEEKILEIAKDRVVLGEGDKKRTLLLHQSPVHLTVEEK